MKIVTRFLIYCLYLHLYFFYQSAKIGNLAYFHLVETGQTH